MLLVWHGMHTPTLYKKRSCRRETARRFVSLNILLSYSRSLKWHCWVDVCKYLLVFHWNYVCMLNRLWDIHRKVWRNLKTEGMGRSRLFKMVPFDRSYKIFYWLAIVSIAVCTTIFNLWHWIIVTLKRLLKVIETATIWKLGCGFLFTFYSNYGRIFNRWWDIQRQRMAWPWD